MSDKARTDADARMALARLHERLVTHATSLSEGRHSAVADLAAVLRTLMVRGKGDDALRRTAKRFSLPSPVVHVSRPIKRTPGVVFAFGGLPVTPDDTTGTEFFDWSLSLALAKTGLRREYYDWAQFINEFANTNGSHLSGTIPAMLAVSRVHAVSDLDLGTYLVWCAAEVTGSATEQLLTALGLPSAGSTPGPPVRVTGLRVADTDDGRSTEVFVQPMSTASAQGTEGVAPLITLRDINIHEPEKAFQVYARRRDGHYEIAHGWVDQDSSVTPW